MHVVVIYAEVGWQLKAGGWWDSVYKVQNVCQTYFDIAPLPGGLHQPHSIFRSWLMLHRHTFRQRDGNQTSGTLNHTPRRVRGHPWNFKPQTSRVRQCHIPYGHEFPQRSHILPHSPIGTYGIHRGVRLKMQSQEPRTLSLLTQVSRFSTFNFDI